MAGYLEAAFIFILFLGPLIFFHELGHFLVARMFGVRVEVFSLGFGPKLLKFKKGFTEYAISLIPLGGYVKMFGDDPLNKEHISEEDKKYSFVYQSKMARFWIVFGGPLANFLLAYVIFFSLLLIGERLPEIRFGNIMEGSKFYSYGIRSGDVLKKINGNDVLSPSDMMLEGKNKIETLTVQRGSELKPLKVSALTEEFFNEFSKYSPALRKPIVVDKRGRWYFLSISGNKTDWNMSLEAISQNYTSKKFLISDVDKNKINELSDQTYNFVETIDLSWNKPIEFFEGLRRVGYGTTDLLVKNVGMKSPADLAGIKAGDLLVAVDNLPLYSFDDLKNYLQNAKSENLVLTYWRNGQVYTCQIRPEIVVADGKEVKRIGVESNIQYLGVNYVFTKPMNIFNAITKAFPKTIGSITAVADGFKKLITKEVSLKNVGGPIAIAQAATDSFNTSLSYFFQIMALISVNLGVINLFPIPILDGGHLLFILIEYFNRGPVSRRKLEIAQQFGLSVLLLLMVLALFNDFSRIF